MNRHERRRLHKIAGSRRADPFAPGKRYFRTSDGQAGSAGPGTQSYTAQNNSDAQAAVLALSQPMTQPTQQIAIPGNNVVQGTTQNIVLNNVGLQTKLVIKVTGNIAQTSAETLTKTPFGLANIFSNIQVTDLSNYQRINTSGWHIQMLASLRRQAIFGAAYQTDSPFGWGSNYDAMNGPAAVTLVKPFCIFFELPLAYHDYDLRGAVYSAVTSAQWRVQLQFNQNFVVPANSTDIILGCYQSSSNAAGSQGTLSAVAITVYQHYYDQIPVGKNGVPNVPLLSLAWNYLLQSTPQTAFVQGQDNAFPYANMRTFLSTMALFDNAGTFNAGTDVNYWGIQAANLVFLEKLDPYYAALRTRNLCGDDPPAGLYIFDHRKKPVITQQYGNMQLVGNFSTVNAGASILLGYEMLAIQSQAINAGSLATS